MVLKIEIKGTPRERGIQQGEILKERIEKAFDEVFHSTLFREMIPKPIPIKMALKVVGAYAKKKIKKPILKYMPHMYEKMMGIVEGGDFPEYMSYVSHYIEVINMIPGLIYNTNPNKTLELGCSQLFALKGATLDGNDYFARNYDFPTILQAFQMLREETPEDGYRNLNYSQFPWAPSHIGMNEKGLSIGYNNGRSWRKDVGDFSLKGVPSTFLIQEVLEKCATTEEAIELITKFPARTIGGHYGILDDSGDACVIETTVSRFAIRRPEEGLLAHTNHYIALEDANLPDSVRFKVEGLDQHPQDSPRERLKRIEYLLNKFKGKIDKDVIIRILSDHNNREPDDFTVCMHGEASTLATTIINPKKRELWAVDNLPCKTEFEYFSL